MDPDVNYQDSFEPQLMELMQLRCTASEEALDLRTSEVKLAALLQLGGTSPHSDVYDLIMDLARHSD